MFLLAANHVDASTTAAVAAGIERMQDGAFGAQAAKDAMLLPPQIRNWKHELTQRKDSPTGSDHSDIWYLVRF